MSNKELFKSSVEYKYSRNYALLFLVIDLGVILLISMFSLPLIFEVEDSKTGFEIFMVLLLSFSLIFVPFILYYVIRNIRLLKDVENYTFHETEFKEINDFFKTMYFTIVINHDNKKIKVDTRAIFYGGFAAFLPKVSEFINKKVLVAYNAQTEKVVVIKVIE